MGIDLGPYDYYVFAFLALFGTFAGAAALLWLSQHSPLAELLHTFRGVVPTFISVIGVLFALNLVFLANDTWHAHDRALDAIYQEGNTLRSLLVLGRGLPEPLHTRLDDAVGNYVTQVVAIEWPALGHRHSSPSAAAALDSLLALIAETAFGQALGTSVHAIMLNQALHIREFRSTRIAVSRTHVNPLKWAGMAFLGFLMMISIIVVHVDQPRAELAAVLLFAAAAAPSAAIVLIQGNPFQPPTIASPAPLVAALEAALEALPPSRTGP